MNAKDFIHRLKQIKAEVLAFKQYHLYGLNRTDFSAVFIEEAQSARSVNFKLTISIEADTAYQPYIDFGTIDLFSLMTWVWDGHNTLTITGRYYNSYPSSSGYKTALSVISVKPIKAYVWEET